MKEKTFPIKIGLEIHGYLNTKEKLFCMCKINGDNKPNSRICPICTGTPGSKPMAPNVEAVKKMIQIALVFGSKINFETTWQRKHYDWADLPKGYQSTISGAHATPNAVGGKFKGINLTELHLEEDPAQWNPDSGKINYNRSGLPLIEIVTEPEFSDSEQVVEWLKSLILSLSYIKAVRKNAGIKVDVNVSTYGERVEMKNLNSLEKIRKAIDYEILRQVEANEKGEIQKMETLAFDEKLGKTIKMRSKEGAADYRFIPDPDLLAIKIDKKMVNEIKAEMPEMPEVKLARLLKKYKVGEKDARILTRNLELVEFFEKLVEFGGEVENVVIVHGCPSDKEKVMNKEARTYDKHWIPWTKKQLEKEGIKCETPLMPEPWEPDYNKFKTKFEKMKVDENSILIGHSCGCAFLVRWLGETKKKIKKLILVAPWKIADKDKCGGEEIFEIRKRFYNYEIDRSVGENIVEIIFFTSNDEAEAGKKSLELYREVLKGRVISLKNHGHYTLGGMGTEEFPELLDEILSIRQKGFDTKKNLSWITVELLRVLNYNKKSLEDEDVEILPEHLAELIKAVESGKITVLKGKQIMNDFVPKSFSLSEHEGEIENIDEAAIENLCRQVINENLKVVDEYKSGKDASLNYLIGQVMRLSERRADFKIAGECLKRLIR